VVHPLDARFPSRLTVRYPWLERPLSSGGCDG